MPLKILTEAVGETSAKRKLPRPRPANPKVFTSTDYGLNHYIGR